MRQAADTRRGENYSTWSVRAVCLLLAAIAVLPGCVRRRLNVRSDPPGALVYVDNQQIGTTPCSVDFTYYGTREIRLIKPGYETLTVNQPIPTAWYEIPPIDFISENLVPAKIRDNRTVAYNMAPQLVVPKEQLLDRANELRQDTLQYPVQPAEAMVVVPPTGPVPTAVVPSGAIPPPPNVALPQPTGVPFPPAPAPSGGTMVTPP